MADKLKHNTFAMLLWTSFMGLIHIVLFRGRVVSDYPVAKRFVFLFADKVELLFFLIALCNSAGCFFDIIDVVIIVKKQKGDNNANS